MKLSKKQHLYYDIIISCLAVAAAFLAFLDLTQGLTDWQEKLDSVLLAIFLLDYLVRLWAAPQKGKFIKSNLCDLIALLPFYTVFRVFKLGRLANFIKAVKIPRILAFLYRPLKKARRFLDTNGFKYVVFITVIIIVTGGILIHFAEGMGYGDGIWWAFVTATTVGYGDISPSTLYGRIIAAVLMLVGIGLIGSVTSTLTSYFMGSGKKSTRDAFIDMMKDQLDHLDELSDQDVEDLCAEIRALKHSRNPKGQDPPGKRKER